MEQLSRVLSGWNPGNYRWVVFVFSNEDKLRVLLSEESHRVLLIKRAACGLIRVAVLALD